MPTWVFVSALLRPQGHRLGCAGSPQSLFPWTDLGIPQSQRPGELSGRSGAVDPKACHLPESAGSPGQEGDGPEHSYWWGSLQEGFGGWVYAQKSCRCFCKTKDRIVHLAQKKTQAGVVHTAGTRSITYSEATDQRESSSGDGECKAKGKAVARLLEQPSRLCLSTGVSAV